jgi:hypothetical protein
MHVQPVALSRRQSASVLHGALGAAAGVVPAEVLAGSASLLPHAATSVTSTKKIASLIDRRS